VISHWGVAITMSSNSTNAVCTQAQLASAASSGFFCYTTGERIGLVAVAMVGFISLAAVVFMLSLVVVRGPNFDLGCT